MEVITESGVSDLFTMTVQHQGIIWSGGEVLNYLFRHTNSFKGYGICVPRI